jgi:GNAT superfamily N-acetyltransferase
VKFWDRQPRQLRIRNRDFIPVIKSETGELYRASFATEDDAANIASFWNKNYSGKTWHFHISPVIVVEAIRRGFILIIRENREIIGTFACRIMKMGVWCGKHTTCGLLEGLVIHPKYRKRGFADLLMASIDKHSFNRPELRTGLLVYFREIATPEQSYSQAPVSITEYFVCNMTNIIRDKSLVSKPLPEMVAKIVSDVYDYILENYSEATLLSKDTTDQNVFWFLVSNFLIGIADTHRLEHGEPVYEVVFCSEISRPYFKNRLAGWNYIKQAAAELPTGKGLIYASNSLTRGRFHPDCGYGWVRAGGFLSCHVYNWMPPRFMDGIILFPHSCI